jgi:hypothetical protein
MQKDESGKLETWAYSLFYSKINVFPAKDMTIILASQVRGGFHMRFLFRHLTSTLLAAALISPAIITGCAARVSTGYRVHDGYYNDDHVWDDNEVGFYARWEGETHRGHRDFRRRSHGEQQEYFKWRHDKH